MSDGITTRARRIPPPIRLPSTSDNSSDNITIQDTPENEYKSPAMAPKKDEFKHRTCYVSTAGQFRTVIDFTSLFAVIYCTIMVPYDMSFDPPKGIAMRGIDVWIEMFFICEMIINFFTSYFDDHGEEVTVKSKMAVAYLKGWFIIDIASSIPAETATMIAEGIIKAHAHPGDEKEDGGLDALTNFKVIRILRLTKLLRLAKMGQILESVEFNFPSLSMGIGLFRLGFTMMLVSHLNACLFYWIGRLNIGNSWISKYIYGCCDTSVTLFTAEGYGESGTECFDPSLLPAQDVLYVDAVYWSLTTLATVGYGEITPCNEMEQLYTAAAMVIGSAMFAYIVGSISTVAMATNGQELQMRNKILQLQEYLELRKIPHEMAQKIRRQCILKWKNTVFDEEDLLNEFNPKMKRKIVEYIKGDIASKVPLISLCGNEDFKIDLLAKLRPCSMNEETVLDFNESFFDMYVLREGKVDLFMLDSNDNQVFIRTIGVPERNHGNSQQGSVRSIKNTEDNSAILNELGMLAKEPSREKVVARGFADLYLLRRTDFEEVCKLHSDAALKPFFEERIEHLRSRLNTMVLDKVGDEQTFCDEPTVSPTMSNADSDEKGCDVLQPHDKITLLPSFTGSTPLLSPIAANPSSSKLRSFYLGSSTPLPTGSSQTMMELKDVLSQVQAQQLWCQQSIALILASGLRPPGFQGQQPTEVGDSLSMSHVSSAVPSQTPARKSSSRSPQPSPLSMAQSDRKRNGSGVIRLSLGSASPGNKSLDVSQSHWV